MTPILVLGAVAAYAFVIVLARRDRAERRAQAATARFAVDEHGVERDLADGRHEAVTWAEVERVEVVTLPKGPWAQRVRVVLHGGSDERGCIVPLDVAEDGGLLAALGRLPHFDHRALHEAITAMRTGTVAIWHRAPAQ
jgi:hypothetical protein